MPPQVAGFAELLFNSVDKLFEGACDVPTLLSPTAFAGAHVHQLLPKVRRTPMLRRLDSGQQSNARLQLRVCQSCRGVVPDAASLSGRGSTKRIMQLPCMSFYWMKSGLASFAVRACRSWSAACPPRDNIRGENPHSGCATPFCQRCMRMPATSGFQATVHPSSRAHKACGWSRVFLWFRSMNCYTIPRG